MKKEDIARSMLKIAGELVNKRVAGLRNHWSQDGCYFDADGDEFTCTLRYPNKGGNYILSSILGGAGGISPAKDIAKNNYPGKDVAFVLKWKVDDFSDKMLEVIKKNIDFPVPPKWIKSGKLKTFFDELQKVKKQLRDGEFNPVRDMKNIKNELTDAKLISVKIKDSTYEKVKRMDEQGEFLFKMEDELTEVIEIMNSRVHTFDFKTLDKWKKAIEKIEREAKKPSEKEFVEAIQSKFDWDEFYNKLEEKKQKDIEYGKERAKWYKTDEGKAYLKRKHDDYERMRTDTYGT